jgi:hypothetical protein
VISFAVSLMAGLFVLVVPFLVGYGGCSLLSLLGFCSTSALIIDFLIALVVFVVVGTVGGVVVYVIWSAIPAWFQVLLIILLLAVGILLAQPELDVISALGIIFTLMGTSKQLARR